MGKQRLLKSVIFDLDGTLVDSKIDFRRMKRESIRLLEAVGVPKGLVSVDMLNYEIEKRSRAYLRSIGVSEEAIQRTFQRVTEIMNEAELEAVEKAQLLDGVEETLEKLKTDGLLLGIITRGCREYVLRILEKFGLRRFFGAIAARDDVAKPKPDPEHPTYLIEILGVKPSETLLVGDHPIDALCAKEVGINCVLVQRRTNNFQQAYQTIHDLRELLSILS